MLMIIPAHGAAGERCPKPGHVTPERRLRLNAQRQGRDSIQNVIERLFVTDASAGSIAMSP
jgi:hypothetical protein